jgi:Zn-dependent metalloprotease
MLRIPFITTCGASFFSSDHHQIRQKGYNPPSHFVTKIDHPTNAKEQEIDQVALGFLSERLQLPQTDLKVTNSYCESNGLCHVYLQHHIKGIPVTNHPAAVHFAKGKIVTYSHSFDGNFTINECIQAFSMEDAVAKGRLETGLERNDTPVEQIYYDTGKGIVLAYQMQLQGRGDFVSAGIDSCTGELVHITSYVNS